MVHVARGWLCVVRWVLVVAYVCGAPFVVRCLTNVLWCVMCVVCWMVFVVRCVLCAIGGVVFGVCMLVVGACLRLSAMCILRRLFCQCRSLFYTYIYMKFSVLDHPTLDAACSYDAHPVPAQTRCLGAWACSRYVCSNSAALARRIDSDGESWNSE